MTSNCRDTSHSFLHYPIFHRISPYRSPTAVRDTGPSFLITAYCISTLSLCALNGSDFGLNFVQSHVTGGLRTGVENMSGYADDVGYRVRRDAYQRLF